MYLGEVVMPVIFASLNKTPAQVAKLVDALCSGRSVRKDVMVRIHSWALEKMAVVLSIAIFVSRVRFILQQ